MHGATYVNWCICSFLFVSFLLLLVCVYVSYNVFVVYIWRSFDIIAHFNFMTDLLWYILVIIYMDNLSYFCFLVFVGTL
jgi:hypothetical protein